MLETYPQENMNTQAIRELTEEVFRLKQRQSASENDITKAKNDISNLEETKQKNLKLYPAALTISDTITAGGSKDITITKASLIGLTIIPDSATILLPVVAYIYTAGGVILDSMIVTRCTLATTESIIIRLYNYTSEDVTLSGIYLQILATE